jgi:hypothetical protein
MDWTLIFTGVGALVSLAVLLRGIFDKRFDEIKHQIDDVKTDMKEFRKEVNGEFKEIRHELNDINQRLTVLETTSILLEINPQAGVNRRSEAAKKIWDKRNKTIERKE